MKAMILAFGLLMSAAVFAGNPTSHSLVGKILDETNMEGLTGASIRIVEMNTTVYASFDGSFEVDNIPDGTYTLEVQCVSYERMVFEMVEVKNGKIYKKIYLKPLG